MFFTAPRGDSTAGLTPGTINFSPAWHETGHEHDVSFPNSHAPSLFCSIKLTTNQVEISGVISEDVSNPPAWQELRGGTVDGNHG